MKQSKSSGNSSTVKWPFYTFLLLVLGGLSWAGVQMKQPLVSYDIVNPTDKVSKQTLDQIISPFLNRSFWDVDLHQLHAALTRLDWIDQAKVKRVWPNKLSIELKEQAPIVRWGEDAFLNQRGQIFYPNDLENQVPNYQQFVILSGENVQAQPLLTEFVSLQAILERHKWTVQRLDAYADGVWRIKLLSGIEIWIASAQWQVKLKQFFRAYPKVTTDLRKFAQVYDLRYSNGFVIQKSKQAETVANAAEKADQTQPKAKQ